jgi:hypothetical protein
MTENNTKRGPKFKDPKDRKRGVNMQIPNEIVDKMQYATVRQIGEDAVMKAYKKIKV